MKWRLRTIAVTATSFACALSASAALAQTSVDLATWNQKGSGGNGDWNVENGGASVFQTINGNQTYYVSPNDFFNTTIEGTFLQDQARIGGFNDDDFIGFVFGYNEPGDNSTDASFFNLNWKQGDQSGTEQGFRLAKVNGTGTPPFSNAENDIPPNYDVLAINTGTGPGGGSLGWVDNTEYQFDLLYTDSRIKIDIAGGTGEFDGGLTIFDLAPGDVGLTQFETGQFGFYNYSQAGVEYRSFTLTEPVLATTPGDTGNLEFLARVGDSDSQAANVANAGGPGTLLIGSAGSPSDPEFAGPDESASFSLGSADDTDFTYTYTPDTRTLGTPDTDAITISSDEDGDHVINFSGQGVGPLFDAVSSVDFNDVDADATTGALINLNNATTDGDLGDLTDLTINAITIGGDDAALFALNNFTPGQTIAAGDLFTLIVDYVGDGTLGDKEAFLTLETDQHAALAGDGDDFQIDLTANAVPEPGTAAAMLVLTLGLTRRRASH